jgi:hypothetical protein
MWGQLEESRTGPFRAFFQAFAEMGWPERSLFVVRARKRGKCAKNSATASAKKILLWPGSGVGLNSPRGDEELS